MRKFLASLLAAAFVMLAVASVSWGNEAEPDSFGGTWETFESFGGTWE